MIMVHLVAKWFIEDFHFLLKIDIEHCPRNLFSTWTKRNKEAFMSYIILFYLLFCLKHLNGCPSCHYYFFDMQIVLLG